MSPQQPNSVDPALRPKPGTKSSRPAIILLPALVSITLWTATALACVSGSSSSGSARPPRRRPDGSAARREALRIIEHMPVWWTYLKKREPKVTAQILDSLKKLDEFHLVTLRWAMDRHQEPARGDAYVDHAFSASCRLRVVNRYVFNVDLKRDLDRAWPLGFDSSGEITLIDEPSPWEALPRHYPDAVAEFDHFKRKFGRRKRRPSGIPPSKVPESRAPSSKEIRGRLGG